jgi:hypothetical protein
VTSLFIIRWAELLIVPVSALAAVVGYKIGRATRHLDDEVEP